jgi:hypothetical protein
MMKRNYLLAAGAALLFSATGLFAQTTTGTTTGSTTGSTSGSTTGSTTGTTTGTTMGKAHPHQVNPNSSAVAQAVQTILAKYDATRDAAMADRKALLDKLAAATTDAERAAILAELKADKQATKDAKAQLGKEIRDEIKTLRQQRKNSGG